MELSVTQENLTKALTTVSRVASSKTQLPILGNILLKTDNNRLLIAATNLEIATTQYIGSKIIKPGSITIPARLITDFISNLPKELIELKVTGNNLSIKSGKYKSVINGAIADDFPELPKINNKPTARYSIKPEDFKQAVSQTIITSSNDTTRPVLTGVYWHSQDGILTLAATDGYRLSERQLIETKGEISAIIPSQTLQEVLRSISDDTEEINISFDDIQVGFEISGTEIISRLIDGNFPDYKQLIPKKTSTNIKINKDEFIRIVKIAGLFARESGGSITITADESKKSILIHSIASQQGENTSSASAEVVGDGQVTLNSRYLLEALSVIDGEDINFRFSGKLAPCILSTDDANTNYYHVIMPLKS